MVEALEKGIDKLYIKRWGIGILKSDIKEIIRQKNSVLSFKWLPLRAKTKFFADPFLLQSNDNKVHVLFEDYDYGDKYGKISMVTLNDLLESSDYKVILDINSHLSYPFIYEHDNKIYVFPESCKSGKWSAYQYDGATKTLIHKKDVIDLPVIDPTIVKHENKYWVFCTMRGKDSDKKLYLFYADNLWGPYTPHPSNPIKDELDGSRPAGNIIEVDGRFYRPSQNCRKYYGSSITINRIICLNEKEFKEEPYMDLAPDKRSKYHFGIHTINSLGNLVVVDGLEKDFAPVFQLKSFLTKTLKKQSKPLLTPSFSIKQ